MSKLPYEAVVPAALEEINFLDADLQNCPYHAEYRIDPTQITATALGDRNG